MKNYTVPWFVSYRFVVHVIYKQYRKYQTGRRKYQALHVQMFDTHKNLKCWTNITIYFTSWPRSMCFIHVSIVKNVPVRPIPALKRSKDINVSSIHNYLWFIPHKPAVNNTRSITGITMTLLHKFDQIIC